ncbi:MAG: DUF167 domain-containing protein [Bacteroidetes bacterium]|nr:DUF167 domain-containing protein [Bacteroidota bacterium]
MRELYVQVKPGSSKESVEQLEDGRWLVRLRAKPLEGAANNALIELLSRTFDVPKSHIRIVCGEAARFKKVLIQEA